MIQNFPRPVNPKVKKQTDDQLAKLGQLNQLVRDINQLGLNESSPTGIPFEWFPPAGLTTAGPKFTYSDGVELISYHIKGMYQIDTSGYQVQQYLCTVNFPQGNPFLFPGNIAGSLQIIIDNDIWTSPLSDGGFVLADGYETDVRNLIIYLTPYGDNPQPDNSYNYALIIDFNVNGEFESITGLITYDFEFLLPNFVTPPTIFQD